jgi:tetratricopeptide (TPR) repeat protein
MAAGLLTFRLLRWRNHHMSRLSRHLVVVLLIVVAVGCRRDPEQLKKEYLASGDSLVSKKDYPGAIIQYRNAVAQDGRFGESHAKLAAAYELNGDLRNALAEYVRAADLLPDDVNVQLRAGRLLVGAGRFEEAKARATAALQKEPKNVNGLIVLGNSLAGLKDLDSAVIQIGQAIDQDPHLTFGYANLGMLELRKGDQAAAESAFKRATDINPQSIPAHLNLGNFYWASRRPVEAEREMKIALDLDAKSFDVNRTLAAFYLTSGRRVEAETYLKALTSISSDPVWKIALADFFLENRRPKEAADVLQPLTNNKNSAGTSDVSPAAKVRLAMIDFQAGQRPKAYQSLEEVLKAPPLSSEALILKTRFLLADRKYDDAVKSADVLIKASSTDPSGPFLKGLALSAKGSTDEAVTAFRKVLEIAPASLPARMQLANLYVTRGENAAAIELLNPIIKAQPTAGPPRLLLGEALVQSGNLAAAEAQLVPLAKINPSSAEVQMWLGRLYGAKNAVAPARQAFSRALELQPDSLLALNGLIALDLVEKKYDQARATLQSRLSADPNSAALLFMAASSREAMGDIKDAEALFKRVLEIDSNYIDAYSRLAVIYLRQRRLDEAKKGFEEVGSRNPKAVAGAKTMIGMILAMQNRPDEARQQYEQALAVDPNAAVAANNLAWAYAESRTNLDVALKLAQTAKAKVPNSATVSDTIGWIYYQRGLLDSAITAFHEGVRQDPTNAMIHYHLGLAQLKQGNQKAASEALQRALKVNPQFKQAEDAKQVLATIKG